MKTRSNPTMKATLTVIWAAIGVTGLSSLARRKATRSRNDNHSTLDSFATQMDGVVVNWS